MGNVGLILSSKIPIIRKYYWGCSDRFAALTELAVTALFLCSAPVCRPGTVLCFKYPQDAVT